MRRGQTDGTWRRGAGEGSGAESAAVLPVELSGARTAGTATMSASSSEGSAVKREMDSRQGGEQPQG